MNIDELRKICLSKPAATEEVQWEDHLLFKVGGKMFCIGELDGGTGAAFKVTKEEYEELIEREGIITAPHFTEGQWVKALHGQALKPEEWQHYLSQSYELVKNKLTKKVREGLGK